MRTAMMWGAGVALMTAGAAGAQGTMQHGASYPQPGRVVVHGPNRPMPAMPMRQSRWGSKVGGQWWGGVNAPGGYTAYRQPYRGYRLPTYWVAPRFYVTDWRQYGLASPMGGHQWVRYYDDAVMIDRGGSVYDYRSGIDWDREEGGYQRSEGRSGARSGVGGAVAGAVVGGVAGSVIAGRGNRLPGTLIGAGVGAAAGYALDRSSDRGRRDDRRYDDREPPMAPDRAPPPQGYDDERDRGMHGDMHGRTVITRSGGDGDGYSTRSYSTAGGPVIVNAPYGSVTTVTVASAPVITTTTTTTEYYEDAVTYSRPIVAKRRVYAGKRVYRARAKPRCICR